MTFNIKTVQKNHEKFYETFYDHVKLSKFKIIY